MPSSALIHKKKENVQEIEEAEVVEPLGEKIDSAELLASTDKLLAQIDEILELRLDDFNSKTEDIGEKPYTLADAMREGSSVTDQAVGFWANAAEGKTCALSAAYLAVKARGLA